ncbi:uncharacterized protein METZ01_LOCUS330923, partial [marine metagenome]
MHKSLVTLVVAGCFLFLPMHQVNAGSKYMWNLSKIGVTKTMHKNARKRGTNVKVGVIDGLAYCSHKELKGRCTAWVFSKGTYTAYDDHGTHVATTIAAKNTGSGGMVGVAPKAYIHSYGYFDDNGALSDTEETAAIDHARKKGVRVINMSYGVNKRVFHRNKLNNISSTKNKNIVFVQAAGNEGIRLRSWLVSFQAYSKLKNLIIVGALKKNGKIDTRYSNRPGEGCFKTRGKDCKNKNKFKYFFVVAPGTNIYAGVSNGGYKQETGTSMAAPHVTGVVALLQGY